MVYDCWDCLVASTWLLLDCLAVPYCLTFFFRSLGENCKEACPLVTTSM